jgi:ribosomal-protein-alanine N-acetyltransferase
MLSLRTPRLLMQPCRLPVLTEIYLRGSQVGKMLNTTVPQSWPSPDLQEVLPYFIEMLQADPEAYPWFLWVIIDHQKKVLLGDIGFKGLPDKEGIVEIGYSILPEHRHQGMVTEAAKALIAWAFEQQDVQKVVAECDASNIASIRVLEKTGMQQSPPDNGMLKWYITRS